MKSSVPGPIRAYAAGSIGNSNKVLLCYQKKLCTVTPIVAWLRLHRVARAPSRWQRRLRAVFVELPLSGTPLRFSRVVGARNGLERGGRTRHPVWVGGVETGCARGLATRGTGSAVWWATGGLRAIGRRALLWVYVCIRWLSGPLASPLTMQKFVDRASSPVSRPPFRHRTGRERRATGIWCAGRLMHPRWLARGRGGGGRRVWRCEDAWAAMSWRERARWLGVPA